ncbi:LptA/OstA family protein [Sphingosinicella ginsenosidimutans]|jgi:lipopolysaccharide export system protein LptA|uniref:OstA family protein n=1 Tax=Allosphingosinicella ginsenosidimutans TaxID=1176539 RepID=A0A5C6TST9_9SPHN|nr:LptA/OstA family protein [Sphingosinicella ginsenosidimutans]TXC63240.1 OstA family protein [Sphingosinicella ginsenosidimutans]
MTFPRTFAIGAAFALLLASSASGQRATSGSNSLFRHDSNAPIDVSAARIEVQDRADRAILSGNVVATQGDMRLTSANLIVLYSNNPGAAAGSTGGVQIRRLEASGGVTITQPGQTARGQFAIYDVDRKIVTMIGNVSLVRNDARVQGGRLVLEMDTGRAVLDGGAAGAPGQRASGGRVSGRFTVPQTQGRQGQGQGGATGH